MVQISKSICYSGTHPVPVVNIPARHKAKNKIEQKSITHGVTNIRREEAVVQVLN